ncbi:hypothetical protein F2Y18_15795 [Bacillus cereus]|uniref:hypothetical protein n=1 Tax=Bacillus cereus TaxID=1396 RepID=UPI00122ED61F|nr:hypothetical protein [Bacillus cereus]KAA2396106.1 hypothetical protein F2Y18_15795 [Bacillus cereus]
MSLENISVLCDKAGDKLLFELMQDESPILEKINSVEVLPMNWEKELPLEYIQGMRKLLQFDRADYYVCYNGVPILVLEMTQHGYTGDQSVQRFARINKTAEEGIPFIYFGPQARTRYDELHNANPSFRNVSSDLFRGFTRLTEIYDVPVLAVEWKTDSKGKPHILGQVPFSESGLQEVIGLLEEYLGKYLNELIKKENIKESELIDSFIEITKSLSENKNVQVSNVRKENIDFNKIYTSILNPKSSFEIVNRPYYLIGKAQKLISLLAIETSQIENIVLPNGSVVPCTEENLHEYLPKDFYEKRWLFYHSGYQWRSEPNVGVVTNLDINYCRTQFGKTVNDRKQLLAVHWPRVFFNKKHPRREELLEHTTKICADSPLGKYWIERAQARGETGENFIKFSTKNIGAWSERATVARIYRATCDLVILNDTIIIGNAWKDHYE